MSFSAPGPVVEPQAPATFGSLNLSCGSPLPQESQPPPQLQEHKAQPVLHEQPQPQQPPPQQQPLQQPQYPPPSHPPLQQQQQQPPPPQLQQPVTFSPQQMQPVQPQTGPVDADKEEAGQLKSFSSFLTKNMSDTGQSSTQSTIAGSTMRTDHLTSIDSAIGAGLREANAGSIQEGPSSLDNPFASVDLDRSGPLVANPHQSALQRVQSCAEAIMVGDLQEIRQMSRPHASVREVVETTLMLLGYREAKWAAAQGYFERPDTFLEKMKAFDASRSISRLQFQKLSRSLSSTQSAFDESSMESISKACLGLVRWCRSVGDLLAWRYGTAGDSAQAMPPNGGLGRDQGRALPQPGGSCSSSSSRGEHPSPAPAAATANGATSSLPAAAPPVNHLRSSTASSRSCEGINSPPSASQASPGASPCQVGSMTVGSDLERMSHSRLNEDASPPPTGPYIPRPVMQNLEVLPDVYSIPLHELRAVKDLTVRKNGVGEVTFHGEIDLVREKRVLEELPRIIRLEQGEVVLYPDMGTKPPEGEGLNRPATITLFQCMPPSSGSFPDANSKIKYRERIAKMTEAKGAKFVDYDCDQGIWQFRVEHF